MERRRCFSACTIALALTLSCSDDPGSTFGPPQASSILRPGDDVLFRYDPNRTFGVIAGQAIDIGVWHDSGTIAMFDIVMETGPVPQESIKWMPYTVYPAFEPQDGGFWFHVTALNPFCLGGPLGHCTTGGNIRLRVRASAPIARMASSVHGRFENTNTPFAGTFPHTIAYTGTAGAALLDTLFVANAGHGSFTATFSNSQSWLQIEQPSVTADGPKRVREQPNGFVVLRRGNLPPGTYRDTVAINGLPTDNWSWLVPTRIAISLQIN